MGRSIVFSTFLCLIFTLSSSAENSYVSPDDPNITIYTLNPVYTSSTMYNDFVDGISGLGYEQAWFAFDLSSIPDKAQVVSASLSVYIVDEDDYPNQRTLWYDSDDDWINNYDPGDAKPAESLVSVFLHDDSYDPWVKINISHDWTIDLTDNYVTLMLTGPIGTAINDGYVATKEDSSWGFMNPPTLTLSAINEPNIIYSNLFNLDSREIIQDDDSFISIGINSEPSLADWNNDGLKDLIIGTGNGKLQVYLNSGTSSEPQFTKVDSFYVRPSGLVRFCEPSGCMGCFPRVVYWNDDKCKDVLLGQSDGTIQIFLNINTDEDPIFDGGAYLTCGSEIMDVGSRSTPSVIDWNNDGRKDIISGSANGTIVLFINEGTDTEPVFIESSYVRTNEDILTVPWGQSCPTVADLDFDGKKDILTGNEDGELLFYRNIGSDESPVFADYEYIESNGMMIDLTEIRSRPFICYWNDDAYPDLLMGSSSGRVYLYKCKTPRADMDKDGDIDFEDLALFSIYWGKANCENCSEADINNDGKIDADDLSWITANWLLDIK